MGGIGERARQQLAGLGGGDDLDCPVRHALGEAAIKRHTLGIDLIESALMAVKSAGCAWRSR